MNFNFRIENIGMVIAPFLLLIDSSRGSMRFLTSKASLFLISLIFIFILVWMNISNINSSSIFTESQGSTGQQNRLINKLSELTSGFLKWLYEFSQPFAAEVGKSLQSWGESQKSVLTNAAVQWVVNQKNNFSTNLHSLLDSFIGNSVTPH